MLVNTVYKKYFLLIFSIFLLFILPIFFISLSGCGLYYEYRSDDFHNQYLNSDNGLDDEEFSIVKEVIDGDTLILSNNQRVRLIGINTPESGRYFFDEAKEILEVMVLGKKVRLERDITDKDGYGRLLRYIFLDDLFVNLEIIKRGFANAYTFAPDVKYAEKFLEAERFARLNELGLWELSAVREVEVDLNFDAPGNDLFNLNGEYVIIENTGFKRLNIRGWTVKDSSTNIYEFYRYIFEPGSKIYIFSGKGEDGGGKFYWNGTRPIWNNEHDTLYLRDRKGLLIEIYSY